MSARCLAALTVMAVVALAPVPVTGQVQTTAADTWTPPRTPDGQPVLEGTWTNSTTTSFERPSVFAGREFLTAEEAAELNAAAADVAVPGQDRRFQRLGSSDTHYYVYTEAATAKVVPTLRTSLVVDPRDGIVPIRPEAEARRDYNRDRASDGFEYMTTWDRCITRGIPGSMFPTIYNNNYQILQIPGYVVIRYEMIHDVRIIPLDARPHLGPSVRQWMGDSRGRWEGNTLVIETANFNGKAMIATHEGAGRSKGVQQSEAARVVERFTRVDADTIDYQATIDDPTVYAGLWTVSIPLTEDNTTTLYEYACHEGNRDVELLLRVGPGAEAAARRKQREEAR